MGIINKNLGGNMNKSELIKELSKKCSLTQKDCNNCLNALMGLVKSTLKNGDDINLVGFGKFDVKNKNARTTYNPITKSKITIPASKLPYFKAGKGLKEAIS